VANVAANEPTIEQACRRAIARFSPATNAIDLQRHDFDKAA
jgi:hypothetical protein